MEQEPIAHGPVDVDVRWLPGWYASRLHAIPVDKMASIKVLLKERDALQAEIAELVAALKPFGAIDLVESRLPAEFAMLILRARAAIAKVRKP